MLRYVYNKTAMIALPHRKEELLRKVVAAKNDYEDSKVNIPDCDLYIDIPFARNPFSAISFIPSLITTFSTG